MGGDDAEAGWRAATAVPDAGAPSPLNTPGTSLCPPGWLALREPADAAARADALIDPLLAHFRREPPENRLIVHDLGCGSGSMGRWLASRLPGPQRWVMHDRDPGLLAGLAENLTGSGALRSADGLPVEVELREGDLAGLSADDLRDASLVTSSAVLDLLTRDGVQRLAARCAEAGCPALVTLSVDGCVELDPADPLDDEIMTAFNAHQRRTISGGRLLGPDSAYTAVEAFQREGMSVRQHASPWRLGAGQAELISVWLRGWVAAACEQEPSLASRVPRYLRRRLGECAAGALRVVVGHRDVLAVPPAQHEVPR